MFGRRTKTETKSAKQSTKRSRADAISKEAVEALSYIQDAANSMKGTINVPVADEAVIAEVKAHGLPDQLRRCCFGQKTLRGSIG